MLHKRVNRLIKSTLWKQEQLIEMRYSKMKRIEMLWLHPQRSSVLYVICLLLTILTRLGNYRNMELKLSN